MYSEDKVTVSQDKIQIIVTAQKAISHMDSTSLNQLINSSSIHWAPALNF